MKKRRFKKLHSKLQSQAWFNLSLVLTLWAFALLISIAVTGAVVLYIAHRFGYISQPFPGLGLLILLITCIIFGTGGAILIYRRSTRVITYINKAMDEVAHGNLDIHLNEDYCTEEFRGMSVSFNKMVHELGVNEMLRNDFIANVSHEFKTPLAAIEGYATLLQDDTLTDEERDEYIQRINDTTRRLSNMTGNILMLSRLENQKIAPPSTEFELDEQIRCAILELEPQWSQKELELDIDLDPIKCVAPKDLLYHVWHNLVVNAIKFTPSGGTVTMRLSDQGQQIIFTISDTGVGMTAEQQKHVFEKFYQTDRSRSSQGNGLGLALVKHIATVCGGSVSVESIPDIGSTFTVTLPQNCNKI